MEPPLIGSFAITAICKDGIIVAEDSRGAAKIGDTYKGNDIAYYYDTLQKIGTIRNFAFSSTGQLNFTPDYNSIFFYLLDFERTLSEKATVREGENNLYAFLQRKYPNLLNQVVNNNITFTGYENGVPTICALLKGESRSMIDWGYAVTDKCDFEHSYNPNLTCEEAAELAEKSIVKYAKENNKQFTIGGPIMILKIGRDNKFTWLRNKPTHPPHLFLSDLYKDYFANRIKIEFTHPENRPIFEQRAKEWLRIHR